MSSIGQQLSRELTAQFYRWELRGRGWMTWPEVVQLEPPYRPFEGHYLPPQLTVDDGRIESFGSRLAQRVSRVLGVSEPRAIGPALEDETEEPEPVAGGEYRELTELQIALPPDHQPSGSIFEQFLFSIGHSQGPIAFEVVGTARELVVQITTGQEDADLVRQQLKAYFPEAVISVGDKHLRTVLTEGSADDVEVVEFGLEREFMVPINNLKALPTDPLVSICGALDRLQEGEAGLFQVLLEPAREPWAPSMMRAVTLSDGRPFFISDPELVAQTRLKVSRPLFATVVRLAARSPDPDRTWELIRGLSGGLRPLGATLGNRLVPLTQDGVTQDELLFDVILRQSHRSGILLNSDEVVALAHLPTAAVRARSLRRVLQRTKAAPGELMNARTGVRLGVNDHEGVSNPVWLPDSLRLNHCHILGGTGAGKSTLLSQMAWQDIRAGRGVAVIDPHGDLIDLLIPHIPPERIQDVILFDPTDEDYAIAFNPLAASSERERDLLATDFIAVMKQNTSNWGDQMSSLLGNAVLAFLHSTKGGTLPELRRFLSDPRFRAEFLKSVTSPEVAYFWESEAQLANKTAIGSILTRLDSLLRYESLLHILGQRANRLDFAGIMDSGKIFLARLAKGLIGKENAHLLGSLLVSRFYQTTIARQARTRDDRRPYFLILDEAADQLTSTVSEILRGTRKYGLGLTLAHQSLSDLRHDPEIYGAVTGNCGNKFCFQVGGDDARKLAEEFAGFTAADLMNQLPRFGTARVGPRDRSFNLEVSFLPEPARPLAEAYAEVLAITRQRYGTPRATIREELSALRGMTPPGKGVDPFANIAKKAKQERDERLAGESPKQNSPTETTLNQEREGAASEKASTGPEESAASSVTEDDSPFPNGSSEPASTPSDDDEEADAAELRRDPNAESVKNEIIQAAGGWGFSTQTEKQVNENTGRVDLVLGLGSVTLACEISVTTSAKHEVGNLEKCLRAGFQQIFYICDPTHRRRRTEEYLKKVVSAADLRRVEFLTKRQLILRLGEIAERVNSTENPQASGVGKTVLNESNEMSAEERQAAIDEAWAEIQRNKERDRKKRQRGD